MESYPESYVADTDSPGRSIMEKATITRCKRNYSFGEKEMNYKSDLGNSVESGAFWALIGVMILLAAGNLFLTFFAMGVLRLGTGMESIEFIPGQKMTKFFGSVDLGNIHHKNGIVYSYVDEPFSIRSDNSKLKFIVRAKESPPLAEITPKHIKVYNVDEFKVVSANTKQSIFSTKFPTFSLPRGVQNLNVKRSRTARVVSPSYSDLEIRSDSTIRLKGNEGLRLEGKKVTWVADQDIYLNTLNGSVYLEGATGIYIEVNELPLAGDANLTKGRGQYKLCVCLPLGQIFRVPVPIDNNKRNVQNKINCSSFNNPCNNPS